jgi:hypothetical protein
MSDSGGVSFGDSVNISGSVIAGAGSEVSFNQRPEATNLASLDDVRAALMSLVDQLRRCPPGVADPGALSERLTRTSRISTLWLVFFMR